jgi:gas vesicle protein
MKSSGRMFVGILAAATAGVIIGMLIAPQKGEDLRKDIRDTADDWAKKLSNLMKEGKEQFNNLKSSLDENIDDFKNEVKNTNV